MYNLYGILVGKCYMVPVWLSLCGGSGTAAADVQR